MEDKIEGKDIIKQCQRVEKPTVELPVGYELYDDEDCVYLLYGDELVAMFHAASVDPAEIVKTANRHKQDRH